MSRIETRFAALKAEGRTALVTFTMAYDPNRATAQAMLNALPAAGADVIELGIPFSDPMADGPIIQEAGLRALNAGATLKGVLEMVAEFRQMDADTPVILMGYYNPIFHYGGERFAQDAVKAGVDGVIIVDLPTEELGELQPAADKAGLALIRLIAPTTGDERLHMMMQGARGFAYYIAVAGVTGQRSAELDALEKRVTHLKRLTSLPLAVGFGVKSAEQCARIGQFADAVVIGSAIVSSLHTRGLDDTLGLVRELADALHNANAQPQALTAKL